MSKYIYTTIYEQFTGLKPPEPKDHKPRRRRGYGHPYRMRLNMQEGSAQNSELLSDRDSDRDMYEVPVAVFQPSVTKQSVRRFSSSGQSYRSGNSSSLGGSMGSSSMNSTMNCRSAAPEERHSNTEPKVTYKKRRQYGPSSLSIGSMSRDSNDNSDY
ncbi:hypothetical protein [Endozoicomonas sp. SCSIO W0465]|uniref:hypothetical protein n=1 Tax=Endozoicomonas sp. SCSIO W0465 TaxID=2918516 RepID=UPI002075999A|nr:hypothetical protein [Endozoicomonas sp. SCSIO W0465]USE33880.1 hypothetical protein MJO57_17050 [Endozoicomonas sp. SCSIO W0465]